MTGVGQVAFPGAADGSMVEVDGKVVGSKLIGQDFQGRPRGTSRAGRPSTGYAPTATFFNNHGPNQTTLAAQLAGFVARLPRARAALRRRA